MYSYHFLQSSRCPHVMARYQKYRRWCTTQGLPPGSGAVMSLEDYCAMVIQDWWRRRVGGATEEAPPQPQERRVWDGHTAATAIQGAWRRYNVRHQMSLCCYSIIDPFLLRCRGGKSRH